MSLLKSKALVWSILPKHLPKLVFLTKRKAEHSQPSLSKVFQLETLPRYGIAQEKCLPLDLLLLSQVVSDSMQPHRWQPTRLPRPWDSPGKNTGVGCHFPLQCMKVKSENEVAQSCPTLSDPMDYSLPGSSIHGISRQEYWSGVPLPSPSLLT